jgi:hypothetical protein
MNPSPAWNLPMVLAWRTSGGMLFQVMVVRGKKEKRYTSARVYIVLTAAFPLVLQSDGMSRCTARISTKLCTILYIRTDLAFVRPCSRDSHFKLETIDVTVPGSLSWTLFNANHAALSCIESSWDIWFVLYGSHTALAYPMDSLSSLLLVFGHACIFTWGNR